MLTSRTKDDLTTVNMKLFHSSPPPPSIKPWHVPVSDPQLPLLADDDWDLTLLRVLPHINGVYSIAQIASLANADIDLTCQAIEHLVCNRQVLLADVFRFAATYVTTPEIRTLLFDIKLQQDCIEFVASNANEVKRELVVELYASLTYGTTLREWCSKNWKLLKHIDIRRFVVFGVIKGFLYRTHKFTVPLQSLDSDNINKTQEQNVETEGDLEHPTFENRDQRLGKYLDRAYGLEEICTNTQRCESEVLEGLEPRRDIQILQK